MIYTRLFDFNQQWVLCRSRAANQHGVCVELSWNEHDTLNSDLTSVKKSNIPEIYGPGIIIYTLNLVIFAWLNFREFLILRLFTKITTREFLFFSGGAIFIIIFPRFLNSQICPPREIREN